MSNSIYVIKEFNTFFGSIDEDTERIIYRATSKEDAYTKCAELSKGSNDSYAGYANFGSRVIMVDCIDLNPVFTRRKRA